MAKTIDVFVMVEPGGEPVTIGVALTSRDAWGRLAKTMAPNGEVFSNHDFTRIAYLKSIGWTTRPAKLTIEDETQ